MTLNLNNPPEQMVTEDGETANLIYTRLDADNSHPHIVLIGDREHVGWADEYGCGYRSDGTTFALRRKPKQKTLYRLIRKSPNYRVISGENYQTPAQAENARHCEVDPDAWAVATITWEE